MKRKLFPLRLKGRPNSKQLLALLLSLACVITCTVGAIIGFTFASAGGKLEVASPGAAGAHFGGGTLRAYLEENPFATPMLVDGDTLTLVLEAAGPTASGGGGGIEPGTCGCADAVLCGGDQCDFVCACEDAAFCGDGVCDGCPVCQEAVFCGDGVCDFVCVVCREYEWCGNVEFCHGDECENCVQAAFCGDGVCDGCPVCRDAVVCGDGACGFVCDTCKAAVFCGDGECGGCPDCVPAVPCDCEYSDCGGCDRCGCCGESGEETEAGTMNDVTLYAELPAHVRDYFIINSINTTPGAVLDSEDDGLGRGWKFELQLEGPLEEGMLLQLILTLTFDRGAYNAAPVTPEVLMDMLENIQASYCTEGEEHPVTQGFAYAPQVAYPTVDTEPDEELHAAMYASVTREGAPVAGKFVRAGDVILYEIVITNDGEEAILGLAVEAPIPAGTSFLQCVDGWEFLTSQPDESPLAWEIDLPVGSMTLSFEVNVEDLPSGFDHRSIEAYAMVADSRVDCDDLEQYANYQSIGDLYATLSALPGGGAVSAGWPIVYTIALTNVGDAALNDIPVRCTIPEGATLLSIDPMPADEPTDELHWIIDEIEPNETAILTFTVAVQELPGGSEGRTLTATAFFTYDGEAEIGTVTHTQSPARLVFAKRGDVGDADVAGVDVSQGDTITYTVNVTNEGGNPAYNINIFDALPYNLDYVLGSATGEGTPVELLPATIPPRTITCDVTAGGVTDEGVNRCGFNWTINQLLPGETAEVSFQARVTAIPEALSGRWFDNTAWVNGEDTNQVSCRQRGGPLDAEKYADPPHGAYVRTGDTILYTIRVENLSADPQYDVLIQDAVPEGTRFGDDFEPIVTIDGAALANEFPLPGDETEKSGLFNWSLEDRVVRFVVGEIPEGSIAEAAFRVEILDPVGESPQSTRGIDNTAQVQGRDTNTVTHIQALRDIAAVKSAFPADGATVYARRADGSGTRIAYSIQVTNTSGQTRDVEVEDTLPEGLVYVPGSMTDEEGVRGEADESGTALRWVVENLEPGESFTVQFKADVGQLPGSAGREFVNRALAGGYETNYVTHYQYASSLRTVKSADPAPGPVEEDELITYTIEVENTGDADEFDLPVFDGIPEGTEYVPDSALLTIGVWSTGDVTYDGESLTWVIPELGAGETALITFQVKVLPLPESIGMREISNRAQAGQGGQARMTNTVTHRQGGLDLTIEKSADKTRVAQGGTVTYTIAVNNNGSAAADIPVSDMIPDGMTYVPESATQDENIALQETAQDGAVTRLDWVIASLASKATAEITFRAKADSLTGGAQSKLVENVAEVNGVDTNIVTVEVYSHLLSAAPPGGSTVQVGDAITYKISLFNTFENDLPALQVVNALPAGTRFAIGSVTGIGNGAYIAATNRVEWNIEALPFGLTELTFQVEVLPAAAGGEIRNRALIYGYGDAAEETNEVFHPVALPGLFAEKAADIPSTTLLKPGNMLTYTITVWNNTDEAMEGIPVLDAIPAGTAYVAGSADNGGVYVAAAKAVRWTIDIDAQDSVELGFRVKVDDIDSGQVTIANKALYGAAGAAIPDIFTNAVTHTAAAEALPPLPGNPHVTVVKGADVPEGQVKAGQYITYTLRTENTGSAEATGIAVRDVLPAGVSFFGSPEGSYNAAKREISWAIPSLEAGKGKTLTFTVRVNVNLSEAPLSVKNKAFYIPGAWLEEKQTNEITHVVSASVILPPGLWTPGSGGIHIGAINIGSGNVGSGNTSIGNTSIGNISIGNSGNSNSGNSNSGGNGNIGGKGIPKTSEASALWAIVLTLGSGAVAAAAAAVLIRKKKALARMR